MPKYNYWVCTFPHTIEGEKKPVKSVGSSNFNNLHRHETPWCRIEKKTTNTMSTKSTWGGYNGDVSRKFLKDWNEYCRRICKMKSNIEKTNIENIQKMLSKSERKTDEYLEKVRVLLNG